MDTKNTSRQLRYLEEVRTPLHRAGFGTLPVEGEQLPVLLNGTPLCRITGKGSVFYRREDADTPQAEDALYRVEDIAAKTLEYMTAMEAAPQLKAGGLDGDYRILADFGGTVLAGSPSKYGVQFVTWDWDYDRTGVVHGHYFMENYDGAKQDFATRSGLTMILLYAAPRDPRRGETPVTRASAVPAAALAWGSSVEYRQQRKSKKAAPQGAVPPRYGAAFSALRQKYGDRPLLSFIWTACNRFFSLSPGRSSYLCRKAKFRKEVLTWIRTSIITASSFCCASFGKAAASAKRSCGG